MALKLNVNNFINQPSPGDRVIYIYDNNGNNVLQIDPYSSSFLNKKQFIYIITDGKPNYNTILDFGNKNDGELALSKLNDNKKYFINDLASNGCSETVTIEEFNNHTGDTNLHLTVGQNEALDNSNNPSSSNPYITYNDLVTMSGDTKKIKISQNDTTEGFIFDKLLTGNTLLSYSIINQGNDERLLLNIDLSNYININQHSISGLTDVNINNLQNNNILKFNGNYWVNTALTLSDISDYNDNNYVHTISDELIYGNKTFENIILSGITNYGEINLNVNNLGEIIPGNIRKIQVTINSNYYCDAFLKNLTYSCIWFYSVRDNLNNIRTGTINAAWNENTNILTYNDISTTDIGDTNDIKFEVNMDAGNTYVRLFAYCTKTWNVRLVRLDI